MSIAEGISGIFEDPSLLNRQNIWSQPQTQGAHFYNYSNLANYENLPSGASVTWEFGGIGQFSISGTRSSANIQVINYNGSKINPISLGVIASASNPTIVSGTVYQNASASYQTIDIPCYATTAGTAGTVAVAYGSSGTPSTIYTQYVSGSTSSTAQSIIHLRVPSQWYYEVTATGVTLGTPTMIQE